MEQLANRLVGPVRWYIVVCATCRGSFSKVPKGGQKHAGRHLGGGMHIVSSIHI